MRQARTVCCTHFALENAAKIVTCVSRPAMTRPSFSSGAFGNGAPGWLAIARPAASVAEAHAGERYGLLEPEGRDVRRVTGVQAKC